MTWTTQTAPASTAHLGPLWTVLVDDLARNAFGLQVSVYDDRTTNAPMPSALALQVDHTTVLLITKPVDLSKNCVQRSLASKKSLNNLRMAAYVASQAHVLFRIMKILRIHLQDRARIASKVDAIRKSLATSNDQELSRLQARYHGVQCFADFGRRIGLKTSLAIPSAFHRGIRSAKTSVALRDHLMF